MKKENELWKSIVSSVLIVVLMFCAPFEALAQSSNNRCNVLENGTQMILRVNENFKADNKADTGTISSIVETDVYSADGTRVLIKAGTPAFIEFTTESNGAWGKAGKICLTHATTKTIDNKRVHFALVVARMVVANLEDLSSYLYCFSPLVL